MHNSCNFVTYKLPLKRDKQKKDDLQRSTGWWHLLDAVGTLRLPFCYVRVSFASFQSLLESAAQRNHRTWNNRWKSKYNRAHTLPCMPDMRHAPIIWCKNVIRKSRCETFCNSGIVRKVTLSDYQLCHALFCNDLYIVTRTSQLPMLRLMTFYCAMFWL